MPEFANLTWEAVKAPAVAAVLVGLLMVLVVKPIIDIVAKALWNRWHPEEPIPEDWDLRGLVANVFTLGLSLVVATLRLKGEGFGPIGTNALVTAALATLGYESLKNLFRQGGVDISRLLSP